MKRKYFYVALLFSIWWNFVFAQESDSLDKFRPKLLTGFFVLFRDSIVDVNSDATVPLMDFKIFYLENLENENLENLKKINLPSSDSLVFISSGSNYAIASSQDHKRYIKWLVENNYFEKADKGINLFDLQKIPKNLLISNNCFASIYKGSATVLGPFLPYNKLDLKSQKLFMCIPVDSDRTEYKYSIVF